MAARDHDWGREENEAIVADYFSMLSSELIGQPVNKADHNRRLQALLPRRSRGSIEWKHQNISAVLLELGCQYIAGYQPAFRYQTPLREVVESRLEGDSPLRLLMANDADRTVVAPEPEDILQILTDPPRRAPEEVSWVVESRDTGDRWRSRPNYLEREAQNRALGDAGESLAIQYERARLKRVGRRDLADRIEHVSQTRGDGDGFDILSFEASGQERFIEVKATKGGHYTPFFVTRNELRVSESAAQQYYVYRFFDLRVRGRLYQLHGDLRSHCRLDPMVYRAIVI